jgi:hypothetical protein
LGNSECSTWNIYAKQAADVVLRVGYSVPGGLL